MIQLLKKPHLIDKFDNKNISADRCPSGRTLARGEGPNAQRRPVYLEKGNHPQGQYISPYFSNEIYQHRQIGVPFGGFVSPWLMRWFLPSLARDVYIFPKSTGLRELPNEFARKYLAKYTHLEKYPPHRRRLSLRNIPTFVRLALLTNRSSEAASYRSIWTVHFEKRLANSIKILYNTGLAAGPSANRIL